ncbi:PspC domain-containing protein [Arthrobacter sp. JCM 19049]|uniref:PspC domain-containing protein n=1 Tax=Arthrobacter sp. JCM 19049 TaxID=1460643 RepID=UPI0006D069FA|nr:PspC domain-containing protein [Arthrobacter sp. JCM 19049]
METPEQPRRIVRSESRLLAGVCAGLAEHLNLPVSYVRLGFLLLTAIGGIGAVLYAWLWVFTPSSQESQADEQRSTGTRRRSLAEELGLDAPGSLNPREVALKLGPCVRCLWAWCSRCWPCWPWANGWGGTSAGI